MPDLENQYQYLDFLDALERDINSAVKDPKQNNIEERKLELLERLSVIIDSLENSEIKRSNDKVLKKKILKYLYNINNEIIKIFEITNQALNAAIESTEKFDELSYRSKVRYHYENIYKDFIKIRGLA